MKKLLVLLLLVPFAARAADGTLAVTPGTGATIVVSPSGSDIVPHSIPCDRTTVSQCVAIDSTGHIAIQAPATLPLPTGAATAAKQPALGTAGSASADVITIQGIASMTPLLAAESGTWNITNISGTISLPTGAATSALQTTTNTALGAPADAAWSGSGSGAVIPILKSLYIAPNAQGGIPTTPTPTTTGGLSIKSLQVAANTTSVAVDASPGQLYGIEAFNNSTTIAYIKLYNTAQGSTTCGSGTVIYRGMIPGPAAGGGGYVSMNLMGLAPFTTAITACITTGFADNDTTAPAASAYIVNFFYK